MSGNFSRYAHQKGKNYSRVSLTQGAPITESDQREGQDVLARLTQENADMAIGSGVPQTGGILTYEVTGGPPDLVSAVGLQPGRVMADGLWAELRGADGFDPAGSAPLSLLSAQHDLLAAGDVPGAGALLLYADIWDRHVGVAEDIRLVDPAFLSMETAIRKQRVAQLKLLDGDGFQDSDRDLIEQGLPRFGDLRLMAAELTAQTPADDPCDPCATVVDSQSESGNALFRIEIHDSPYDRIVRDGMAAYPRLVAPADRKMTVKFSRDNAALEVPGSAAQSLIDDPAYAGFVFEIADLAGEQALGLDTLPSVPRGAVLVDLAGLETAAAGDGLDGRIIRVWDGAAVLDLSVPDLAPSPVGTHNVAGRFEDTGSQWLIDLVILDLSVTLTGMCRGTDAPFILPGDAWVVEIREYADEMGEQVRFDAEPVGICHHYACIGRIQNGAFVAMGAQDDMRSRRFAALTELDAQSVSWSNHHHPDIDTNTVQGAIDLLWARDMPAGDDCICTFCINPDGDLTEQLGKIAEALAEGDPDLRGNSARICFPRGQFVLKTAVAFEGLGHISLHGAGRDATEVILSEGAGLRLIKHDAVTLADLGLASGNSQGVPLVEITDCDRVEIRRCAFGAGRGPGDTKKVFPLLRIDLTDATGGAAWVTDNLFVVATGRTGLHLTGGALQHVEGNLMTGPGRPSFQAGVLDVPEIVDLVGYIPRPAGVLPGRDTGIYVVPGADDFAYDLTGFDVSERDAVFGFISETSGILSGDAINTPDRWQRFKDTVTLGAIRLEGGRADSPADPSGGVTSGRRGGTVTGPPVLGRGRRAMLRQPDLAGGARGGDVAVSPIMRHVIMDSLIRPVPDDVVLPVLDARRHADLRRVYDDLIIDVAPSRYRRAFGVISGMGLQGQVAICGNRFDWVHSAIILRGALKQDSDEVMPFVGQAEIRGNHILRLPIQGRTAAIIGNKTYSGAITCENIGGLSVADNQIRQLIRDQREVKEYVFSYLLTSQTRTPSFEGCAAIVLRGFLGPVMQIIGNEANHVRFCAHVAGRAAWGRTEGESPSFFDTVWTFRRNTTLPANTDFAGVGIRVQGGNPGFVANVRIIPDRNVEDDNHPPMFHNR